LLSDSPAIGAGLGGPTFPSTDERGAPRDATPDIGAYERDVTPPTVSFSSTAPNSTKVAPIPVTATFSETVTDFTVHDLVASNGTADSFVPVNGTPYTFNGQPAGQGTVIVSLGIGTVHDIAGNANTTSGSFSRIYDTVPPTVTLSSSAPAATNTAPIPV